MKNSSSDEPKNQITPPAGGGYFIPFQQAAAEDEIDLRELFRVLAQRKETIAAITLFVTLVALAIALLTPKTYRAETLLTPVTEEKGGGLSALAGQLGGLAGLAGISIGGGGGGDKAVSLATLKSRALIEKFIADQNLLPLLFERKWDAETKSWKESDPDKVPDLQDGYDLFNKQILNVSEDKKSGLVTLAIEWKSAELAANWANELVRRANEYLRQKVLDETQKNLAYLDQQAQQTSILEVRQAIYKLMESELKKAMLAKGSEQYAFKVIDPAVVTKKKIRPKRALIVSLGFLLGLFGSVFGVLVYNSVINNPKTP